ncbi:deazaflavin-dependent oxidoreductase, nitroreductase family [Parafrankia irregularis]|uniref:Deazaflavin-dependent oxidoreductase, nitroreductase family n=1 Tax=Parafrankia irregularis TaxID=795642 RepID=A0A0S4QYC3_9ACTN|nr:MULTISPECIES: nitroreductase/quinone reductase family protein [Parafrankia]MBE3206341.1 nitroreductase family deazaflavin-dependent oxidoreductase [Parafrankia sp. CH37]CUU60094.1 deazaflavin-dependent oxidoreductase, nitroreductase family [Parafrankia irregularis]
MSSNADSAANAGEARHYRQPGWFTRKVANRAVALVNGLGLSVWGSRMLEVRGRSSGQIRRVPVNLLTLDGRQYLVSARGHGQWVRNVRAADGELALVLGRRRSSYQAVELTGPEQVPVLRAYLVKWKAEVGAFFEGVGPESSDEELARIAPRHPVFALTPLR